MRARAKDKENKGFIVRFGKSRVPKSNAGTENQGGKKAEVSKLLPGRLEPQVNKMKLHHFKQQQLFKKNNKMGANAPGLAMQS